MAARLHLALWLVLAPLLAESAPQEAREARAPVASRFSEGGWIEYVPGDAPLVLIAPHGGSTRPEGVRDRREGVRLTDTRTLELTRELAAAFHARTGRRPHLVLCHLHRSKLDANRDQGLAAQGDAGALAAWSAWHAYVEQASQAVVAAHGQGLLIDVHGHSHPEAWVEWGYALSAGQLARSDEELTVEALRGASSIDALVRRSGGDRAALLRGPASLGALTQRAGYASVPSPAHPHPDGAHYFDGGYNTRRHGSRTGGEIDAVQLEVPRHLRVEAGRRKLFARDVARGVASYLERWYGFAPAPPADGGG